jgi:hypothetical protein
VVFVTRLVDYLTAGGVEALALLVAWTAGFVWGLMEGRRGGELRSHGDGEGMGGDNGKQRC